MESLFRTAARWGIAGFALPLATIGAMQLNAQALGSHNSRAPVTYAADRIELQDRQDRVVLSGNVDITQADLRLRAPRTLVAYSDAGDLKIDRITASGGVTVTRGSESASGDVAVYDFNSRLITMAGDVRLTRGSDTLNGGRLVINLKTGVASVDGRASGSSSATGTGASSGSGSRVTGSFSVPQK